MSSEDVFTPLAATNHSGDERATEDYYATDPSAIDDLLRKESFSPEIWECACGEGHLSRRLQENGKNVYSTDLVDRGFGDDFFDFLETDKDWNGDIVTNPPYKDAKEFVEKAMSLIKEGQKIAFFLKLTFLESKGREELFEKHPPKRVWVYSIRKRVAKNALREEFEKSSAVCYAWFVWEKGFDGSPELGWITSEEAGNQTDFDGGGWKRDSSDGD